MFNEDVWTEMFNEDLKYDELEGVNNHPSVKFW